MKYLNWKLISVVGLLFAQSQVSANIYLGGTRVIYNESAKNSTIVVGNRKSQATFLVQSWIDSDNAYEKKSPFVVTPPLFRLNANQENTLRIVRTAAMPSHQESLYWLNVKGIPGTDKNDKSNKLTIAIKNRIKLFYRPAGLQGDPNLAYKVVKFHQQGRTLNLSNPTPFHVTLTSIKGNSVELLKKPIMIAPNSNQLVTLSSTRAIKQLQWKAINDYGSETALENLRL